MATLPAMRRILAALGFLAGLLPSLAAAQVPNFPQTLPPNTVVGRLGVSAGPAQAIPFATLATRILPATTYSIGSIAITAGGSGATGTPNCTISGAGTGGQCLAYLTPTTVASIVVAKQLTVGGTITNGDSLVLTFTSGSLSGSPISITVPVVTGDTTSTVAAKLAVAINANTVLTRASVVALESVNDGTIVNVFWPPAISVTLSRTNGSAITGTLNTSGVGAGWNASTDYVIAEGAVTGPGSVQGTMTVVAGKITAVSIPTSLATSLWNFTPTTAAVGGGSGASAADRSLLAYLTATSVASAVPVGSLGTGYTTGTTVAFSGFGIGSATGTVTLAAQNPLAAYTNMFPAVAPLVSGQIYPPNISTATSGGASGLNGNYLVTTQGDFEIVGSRFTFRSADQSTSTQLVVQTITNAVTNGGLCRLTVASSAAFTTGDTAVIRSIAGATACNGQFTITVINGTTIDLQASTFSGAYTSGGTIEKSGTGGFDNNPIVYFARSKHTDCNCYRTNDLLGEMFLGGDSEGWGISSIVGTTPGASLGNTLRWYNNGTLWGEFDAGIRLSGGGSIAGPAAGGITTFGAVHVYDTTQASSTTVAALVSEGGLGVVKAGMFGGTLNAAAAISTTGASAIFIFQDRLTFGTDQWGWYATGGSARLYSQAASGSPDMLTVTNAGVFTFGVTASIRGSLALAGTSGTTLTVRGPLAASGTLTLPAGTTDFSATGGTSQVVKQTSAGGAFTVARLACSDLSDSGTGCSGTSAIVVGTTTITSGTDTRILRNSSGVVGEYTITGTGTVVAMATSPSFTTPTLGVAIGTSLALGGCTISTNAVCATGTANISGAITLGGAITYGGVTLSNAVTGTGNMVLSASPTFSGTVAGAGTHPLSVLATQATNTVVGNATSGTASPTALAVGTCSTAASALIWTTNTGFGCNTSITAAAVPASGLTGTTLASGVVTSSLTSLGTITTLTATTINAFTLGGSISGGGQTITNLASVAIRDTSAAFDVTLAATSSTNLSAGRTLTLNMGNVAHTLAFGTTANTITFPNVSSGTVAMLNTANSWTVDNQILTLSSNGTVKWNVTNANSGSNTNARFEANSESAVAAFYATSTAYSYGAVAGGAGALYNNGAGGITIMADGGSDRTIKLAAGASGPAAGVTVSSTVATINLTAASTSKTTGSLVNSGGFGNSGAIYAGSEITTGIVAVASLPTCDAAHKAARYFVSDNNTALAFAAVITTGGAIQTPVYCDGTTWRQGANDNIPEYLRRKFA